MVIWVFPRRHILVCRRFGTYYQYHLQRLDMEYEVWISQAKPSQAKPSQAKPSQAKPSQAKPKF
jgi:hypothetical protein